MELSPARPTTTGIQLHNLHVSPSQRTGIGMRITLLWFRVTCLVLMVPESTCITTQKTENFSERSLKQSSAKNLHVDLKTFRKLAKPPACMSSSVGHRCLIPSSSCRIHLVGPPLRGFGSLLLLVLAPDGQSHARKPLLMLLAVVDGLFWRF